MKDSWYLATSRSAIEESFPDEKDLRFGLGLLASPIGTPCEETGCFCWDNGPVHADPARRRWGATWPRSQAASKHGDDGHTRSFGKDGST